MATKDGKNGRKNQESTKMIVKIMLIIYLHNLNKPRKLLVLYFFKKRFLCCLRECLF